MPLIKQKKIDPQWFTPESCEGDENPVQFKIKPLTGSQAIEVGTEIIEVGGVPRVSGAGLLLCVRNGLLGWRNYIDERGKEIKFSWLSAQDLPADILSEIAIQVYELTNMSDDEKKP